MLFPDIRSPISALFQIVRLPRDKKPHYPGNSCSFLSNSTISQFQALRRLSSRFWRTKLNKRREDCIFLVRAGHSCDSNPISQLFQARAVRDAIDRDVFKHLKGCRFAQVSPSNSQFIKSKKIQSFTLYGLKTRLWANFS